MHASICNVIYSMNLKQQIIYNNILEYINLAMCPIHRLKCIANQYRHQKETYFNNDFRLYKVFIILI